MAAFSCGVLASDVYPSYTKGREAASRQAGAAIAFAMLLLFLLFLLLLLLLRLNPPMAYLAAAESTVATAPACSSCLRKHVASMSTWRHPTRGTHRGC